MEDTYSLLRDYHVKSDEIQRENKRIKELINAQSFLINQLDFNPDKNEHFLEIEQLDQQIKQLDTNISEMQIEILDKITSQEPQRKTQDILIEIFDKSTNLLLDTLRKTIKSGRTVIDLAEILNLEQAFSDMAERYKKDNLCPESEAESKEREEIKKKHTDNVSKFIEEGTREFTRVSDKSANNI